MTLRIEKTAEKEFIIFTLSGRIEAEQVAELQRLLDLEAVARYIILDLKEVKLLDREAVVFLAHCEKNGAKLRNCPAYIREWISRERDKA